MLCVLVGVGAPFDAEILPRLADTSPSNREFASVSMLSFESQSHPPNLASSCGHNSMRRLDSLSTPTPQNPDSSLTLLSFASLSDCNLAGLNSGQLGTSERCSAAIAQALADVDCRSNLPHSDEPPSRSVWQMPFIRVAS